MGFGSKLKNTLGLGSGPKGNFTSGQDLVRQQDNLNRYNINSAYGSRNFTTDANGRSVLNIEETPYQKALREFQQNQAMNTLQSKTYSPEDFAQQGQDISKALYESSMYNLRPQFEAEDRKTNDYLSNRGIPLGSEAYRRALSGLRRDRGGQLNQLSLQSTLAGTGEQDRLVRLAEAQRAARLAETGSATQGIDLGFFGNVNQIDAAGIISGQEGAQNAYNLNRFQDTQARRNATLNELIKGISGGGGGGGAASGGAASGGAGAAAAASDISLKENIEKVGEKNGFNIYEFNYKGKLGRYSGVMAQEVQKIMPDAVIEKDGYLAVYYDKIGIEFKKIN
jgi:hypothetical protein